jgi:hypothetical protein
MTTSPVSMTDCIEHLASQLEDELVLVEGRDVTARKSQLTSMHNKPKTE